MPASPGFAVWWRCKTRIPDMKKTLLILLAVLIALALPVYGSRQAIEALERHQEPGGLAMNLAWWVTQLPGYGAFTDVPRTRLAVAVHQLHDGAEFGDLPQQQQRGERLLQRLQPWLDQIPQDTLTLKAQQLALATLVRMPRQPAGLAAQLEQSLGTALQAPTAAQQPAMLRLQAAEALALSAARRQDAATASQWQAYAWEAVPAPTDIKAQTLENTARSLIPLRIALAACQPGQPARPSTPHARHWRMAMTSASCAASTRAAGTGRCCCRQNSPARPRVAARWPRNTSSC